MTGFLFREWLQVFELKMKNDNRHILLLLDNAPSYSADGLDLHHIKIHMLPPNKTSKIKPMDAKIIAAFKKRYKRFLAQNAVDREERGEANVYNVDQLAVMRWCKAAWTDILGEIIENCFNHTGLFDTISEHPETIPWNKLLQKPLLHCNNCPTSHQWTLGTFLIKCQKKMPMFMKNLQMRSCLSP